MKKSRYSDSQIMNILKQAEGGVPVPQLCLSLPHFHPTAHSYNGSSSG